MRQSRHLLSLILVSILSVSLLVLVFVRTFIPVVILPKFDISSIMIVSLLALVVNYYLSEEDSHLSVIAFAFVAFGVLPFVTGFVTILDALLLALKGGITFTAVMFVFNSFELISLPFNLTLIVSPTARTDTSSIEHFFKL